MTTNAQLEEKIDEIKRALYGKDGDPGLVGRLAMTEEKVEDLLDTLKELKRVFYGILASGLLLLLVEFINLIKQHPIIP